MLHRARDLLVRQRTQLINALRAHLAELGIIAAAGRDGAKTLRNIVADPANGKQLPEPIKAALQAIVTQIEALIRGASLFSTRIRNNAPSQLFNTNRANKAAGN
jgi:transposase